MCIVLPSILKGVVPIDMHTFNLKVISTPFNCECSRLGILLKGILFFFQGSLECVKFSLDLVVVVIPVGVFYSSAQYLFQRRVCVWVISCV